MRFIETKAIDRTAAREEIEMPFDDPQTLAVLRSNFNKAPAAEARLVLELAEDAGNR